MRNPALPCASSVVFRLRLDEMCWYGSRKPPPPPTFIDTRSATNAITLYCSGLYQL
jgi:hypothetical protein